MVTFFYMKHSVSRLSEMIDVTVFANDLKVKSGSVTEGLPVEIEDYSLYPSEDKEKSILRSFNEIEFELTVIDSKIKNDESRLQLQLLRNMFKSYHESFLAIKNLMQKRVPFSLIVQEVTKIKEESILLNEAIQKFISNELSSHQIEKETLQATLYKNGMILIALIILSAFAAIGVFYRYIIRRSIIDPLETMKETMHKISANASDIKIRVQVKNEDEIGTLGIFFNQMADTIQKNNEQLEETVELRTKQLSDAQAMLVHSSKLSALGEMAGGVAHEINTPLAVISIRIEQLEERTLESTEEDRVQKDEILAVTKTIIKTVKRISTIVAGLKAFARDGSKDPFSRVSVAHLVRDAFSLCSEKFVNHGVKLSVNSTAQFEDQLFVDCRETEITQVLINLLNNSFDAVEKQPEPWISVLIEDDSHFIQISVIDAGQGVPLEIQNKMMQPFFTTKEIGKGTGLGLSISRGIAESHLGKLFIDNQSPNTKFTIRLPKSVTK